MARIWMEYLSFLTGMILSILGAVFILSQVRTPESTSNINSKLLGSFQLQSSSPGIFLTFLGTVIIILTLYSLRPIQVNDASIYPTLGWAGSSSDSASTMPPYTPEQEVSGVADNRDAFQAGEETTTKGTSQSPKTRKEPKIRVIYTRPPDPIRRAEREASVNGSEGPQKAVPISSRLSPEDSAFLNPTPNPKKQ